MIYFTSDTHFFHKQVINFDNRPFKDLEEMQETMIQLWNNTVSKNDIVYHLGDFAFSSPAKWKPIVKRLNGSINLIRGNHDIQNVATLRRLVIDGEPLFNDVGDIEYLTLGGIPLILCHYGYEDYDGRYSSRSPMDCGNWLLHGHTHRPSEPDKRMINVGCMNWNYTPVSWVEIAGIIRKQEETWNS